MTVAQLLDSISSYELSEWAEFYKLREEEIQKEIEKQKQKR